MFGPTINKISLFQKLKLENQNQLIILVTKSTKASRGERATESMGVSQTAWFQIPALLVLRCFNVGKSLGFFLYEMEIIIPASGDC